MELIENNEKAALYVRVSTDAQREEGYSIDAQKEALEGYCKARGFKNYDFYIDGGFSGSNLERPEIKRLIKDAKNGKIKRCIVYKLDRLSRSQKDTLYLIEDILNPNGVDFISINETMDTSTPLGRLMLGILSAFAQLERENIKERTQMGMLERIKEGYWMGGGRIPFGYDYDKAKGILVPNKDAVTVRKIYELYIEGKSAQTIADMLGLKYDRLVMQILSRKSNLGIITYKGKEYPGKHEAIIDRETFEKAMLCMQNRSEKKNYYSNSLFSGLLVCGHCGAKMHYQSWGNTGRKKISCYSQQSSKKYLVKDENCTQAKLWQEDVEEAVLKDLFSYTIAAHRTKKKDVTKDVTLNLEEQLDANEKQLKRLYTLYAKSEDETLLETIEEFKSKRIKLTRQLEKEREHNIISNKRKEILDEVKNLSEIWDILNFNEKRRIVRSLVKEIVITDNNIKIYYLF